MAENTDANGQIELAHWQNSLVLLLAHGSQSKPEGAALVRAHAESLRARNIFAEVRTSFLRDTPHPREVIAKSTFQDIYVVPFMVAEGYSIDVMIPEALSLSGPLTEIVTEAGRKRIHLCRAIGTHKAIRTWAPEAISAIKEDHGLWTADTAALVLCHGTARHSGGRQYAEQIIRDIVNDGKVSESAMLFLEDSPRIEEWRSCVSSRFVIALPYLMTAGRHGVIDIPEKLGINVSETDTQTRIIQGETAGPFEINGRKLWYAPLLGTLKTIPDIIIDRVADWDKTVTR